MKKRVLFIYGFSMFFILLLGVFANQGFLEIIIGATSDLGMVNITSPQNITYNFNVGDNYTINLNVSNISFNAEIWWYTLTDLRHNEIVNNSVIFTPNITFEAVRWSNNLTVYANKSDGTIYSSEVIFYVNVSNSAPLITDINSSIKTCEGSSLSYYFNASDVDEDRLTSSIDSANPFYTRYSSNYNLTVKTYEIYSGILSKIVTGGVDAGSKLYEKIVSVSDGEYSDSASIDITVIEINNAPAMLNFGVQTIYVQGDENILFKQAIVYDIEDGNQNDEVLKFNITILNSTGDEVNLFNISSKGVMYFTPTNASQVGVYDVIVCVNDTGIDNPHADILLECGQDGSSRSVCDDFELTITNDNRAPSITDYYYEDLNLTVSGTKSLYFNVTEYDSDGTSPDAYWYVDDVLVEYDLGSLIDEFTYSFGCGVSGEHNIRVEITDGLLTDSVQWNFTVINVVCPVVGSPGGGGGGGSSSIFCEEKWAYDSWGQCRNLNDNYLLGELDYETNSLIKERCALFNWSNGVCGFQIRNSTDINKCGTTKLNEGIIRECYYTKNPTCEDNILNCHDGDCEVLVDCGGPCEACSTCSDGIKNQNEEDIDCGGPCPACMGELPLIRGNMLIYSSLFLGVLIIFILIILIIKRRKKDKTLIYSMISWILLLILLTGIGLLIGFIIKYSLYQRALIYSVLLVLLVGIILGIRWIIRYFKKLLK